MKSKREIVYAFIDSQNLNLGTQKSFYKGNRKVSKGWKLDYSKFRRYLSDKFRVSRAIFFIGYIPENKSLYDKLNKFGYRLVFKPTIKDASGKVKGNVDAELVLYASAIEYENYDKAVIVSGDGDFYCLYDFLTQKKKLLSIIIPDVKSESSLLKKFQHYKTLLHRERSKLELKAKKSGRRGALSRR